MRATTIAVILAATSTASADDAGGFISGGATIGLGLHDKAPGPVLGGEVSVGYLWFAQDKAAKADPRNWDLGEPRWVGGYVDMVYDWGSDTSRLSFGPELGASIVGIDGGLLVERGDSSRWGWTVRPALTFGIASVYGRYGRFFDAEPEQSFVELGVLLKYPLPFAAR